MSNKFLDTISPKTKVSNTDINDDLKKETGLDNNLDSTIETALNTKRLVNLMNIESAFKKTRLIAILSLVFSFLFCIAVIITAMQMVTKGKGKIYITNGYGNTLTAYQIGANENRAAEAKAQVRDFHTVLYNITPNPEAIKDNLDKVLLLSLIHISEPTRPY